MLPSCTFPVTGTLATTLSSHCPLVHVRLAMSLEVAEHLPAESAQTFIESVTKLAPVTLFSAAVPGQRNRSQKSSMAGLLGESVFQIRIEAFDCVRPRFWENSAVTSYYAQNAVLYIHRGIAPIPTPCFSAFIRNATPNSSVDVARRNR